ncbi:spermatogenesis- and oogenesis-specific basic helix-loop-helix-containing protein 1 [Balaenoptera ricei]|uniref:spermatogenesis- and oogenesis-specific basic helix-loop-helix-containing protein 1 n=1 Tax=Balaenoptera ricei TaxID=2746895 RepID=UPI0028BF5A51|nr:spermatogenesis- and oogenesis-specific basic helix-loop-helix-containing protein 1 [Balaenoptera ricei]
MSITASGLRGRFLGSRSPALLSFLGSGPFLFATQLCCEDLGQGSGQAKAPAVAKGPVSCLPRNVLSERERRKRISLSCERLRALLPQFDGRLEDMASVLEMSVQFLQLASALVPGWEKQAETWHTRQKDVLQLALASQTPAGAPDPGVGTSSVTMQWASPSCAAAGVDDEPPSLVPRSPGLSPSKALRPPPLWSPRSRQPPSPLVSEESQSCLGQAGSPAQGTDKAITLDARSVSGCDAEDGSSFLLTASPDWWLGSLEGRGSSVPSRVPARSSPLDKAEPSFLGDHEPGSQDPPDGPLEPWSSDVSCPSSALRDEVDSIFPDFFAY